MTDYCQRCGAHRSRCKCMEELTRYTRNIRTQKAAGIIALQQFNFETPQCAVVTSRENVAGSYRAYFTDWGGKPSRAFARPCPVRPRHGFVDSRPVSSIEEAEKMFDEAIAADPEAEMLLMPFIDSSWNAIWTPGQLVFGPGHDGATSGHDSVTIPLVKNNSWLQSRGMEYLLRTARIAEGDVPYFEAVVRRNTDSLLVTQLRGGPEVTSIGADFIPGEVTVKRVIKAEGDLLLWETKARRFRKGTVVWHPGGSMASHYAIHCKLNNVPIIISHEPQVGEVLVPTTQLPPISMESVRDGIGAGMMVRITPTLYKSAVQLLLLGLHNFAAFSGNDGFWLGASATIMQRLGTAALLGEARHATKREGLERDQIYEQGLATPFISRRRVRRAVWIFANWPWRGSYGGTAWRECGNMLIDLDEDIRQFVREGSSWNFNQLVSQLNTTINMAHNGGWWLDKFGGTTDTMNNAASGYPGNGLGAVPMAANLLSVSQKVRELGCTYYEACHPIVMPKNRQIRYDSETNIRPLRRRRIFDQPAFKEQVTAMTNGEFTPNPFVKKKPPFPESVPYHPYENVSEAQLKFEDGMLHIQYKIAGQTIKGKYKSVNIYPPENKHAMNCDQKSVKDCLKNKGKWGTTSYAISGTPYTKLIVEGDGSIRMPHCGTVLYNVFNPITEELPTLQQTNSTTNGSGILDTSSQILKYHDMITWKGLGGEDQTPDQAIQLSMKEPNDIDPLQMENIYQQVKAKLDQHVTESIVGKAAGPKSTEDVPF